LTSVFALRRHPGTFRRRLRCAVDARGRADIALFDASIGNYRAAGLFSA
jgi:hypothetical protein